MLKASDIVSEYSGMKALHQVSITIDEGEFVTIVGSNGAGKTTLLKAISGTVRCSSGSISFEEKNITKLPAYRRTEMGLIHIPEGRRIFPSLTVIENLMVGGYRKAARESIDENLDKVFKLFPILKDRSTQYGGSLSGGEQQMLAIGRGIMSIPRLLMLDEPSQGLAPRMADFIFETIRDMREKLKVAILLVEQRAIEAIDLCDRGYIMENGRITFGSIRESLKGNPLIQRAYLGVYKR